MNIKLVILIILLYILLRTTINIINSFNIKENLTNYNSENIEKLSKENNINTNENKLNNLNENKLNISNENKSTTEIKSQIVSSNEKSQFILYWASWCGICNKMKSQWNSAKDKIVSKYPNVDVIDINCDDPKNNKCFTLEKGEKVNLDGVPTIVFRKNNNDIEYKRNDVFLGDRSEKELVKFCSLNI